MKTMIEKRDGEIVDFDKNKILAAITKAFAASNKNKEETQGDISKILQDVLNEIGERFNDFIPTAENINDIVEKKLMTSNFFDIAKAYILYRAEKRRKLEESRKDNNFLRKLTVQKSSGKKVLFSIKKLKAFLQNICNEFDINGESLFDELTKCLYDGIKTEDIIKSLIFITSSYIEKDPVYSDLTSKLFLIKLRKEVFGKSTEYDSEVSLEFYREAFIDSIKIGVSKGILDKRMLKFDLKFLASQLHPERDDLFRFMGLQTLYERYFIKHEGQRLELPQIFWMRVAMGLSLLEEKKEETVIEFYNSMSQFLYCPSTPTLFNSGLSNPQLASCFLNNIEDDLDHIFKVFGDNAQMSKWSGGIGTSWTKVRGTGAFIKKTKVESQGVIPFLKISNDITLAINRSGKRRGAAVVYLECWHWDFEEFVQAKKNTGDERRLLHDINTAAWIPDLFMQRVQEDKNWTLFSPDEVPDLHENYGKKFKELYEKYEEKAANGEIKLFKTIKAVDLWKKMVTALYETGNCWMTWKDPCNIRSPQNHVGVIHNSNLCTEIIENNSKDEVAVCNLASLNLANFVKNKKVNYSLLKDVIKTVVRGLDNVIDINYYPIKEAKTSNVKHRPIGLGVMGIQDLLYQLDLNFEQKETEDLMDELFEFISYNAIDASCDLAIEKGKYSTFEGSKWSRGVFPIDTLALLEEERGVKIEVNRKTRLDWDKLKEKVKKNGLRNSLLLASAPTATISLVLNCFPCIEPIYKNLYVKSNMTGEFTVINEYLIRDLKKLNLWNQEMLEKIKYYDGSIQKIEEIPQKLKDKYKEVFEIDQKQLIKLTAIRGKWICQSQSHNIFLKTKSGKAINDIYMYAWEMGLKTTYYLRTLKASQNEKSTLDNKYGFTQNRDFDEIKSCSIENPECESCQ